ncbi:choline kinase family protein [Agriterribacter sp.]|uniref:choline kinase family protein n=1 Tax=Agriterribacter sp. TaxID=2821509 RepID=UPI002D076A48|nr:choline kinase family protein [Agriterribacter sp.]HTN08415.1 choline kinase family protein [Agriterribacter sp.]
MDKEILDLIYHEKLLPENHSEIVSLKLLKEGMTNSNYLCITEAGSKYVIRIPGYNTSEMIDRKSEWANHHKITVLNLNTKHVAYLKNSWIKVSVYVENTLETITSRYKAIDIACKALKRLHNSDIVFANRFWVSDMIGRYENIVRRNKVQLSPLYLLLRATLKSNSDDFLYSKIKWTACHNDLVKGNILLDSSKNIYLIDWEYSGMNDPLWDLASFILENELTPSEEHYMLEKYHQDENLRPESQSIIALFKIYQDILWYLWAKIKEYYGSQYGDYSEKRIRRALKNYANFNCEIFMP